MKIIKLALSALIAIGAYYALSVYAAVQIQSLFQSCGKDLGLSQQIKASKSESEFREALISEYECIDKRVTFPSSLFFKKQQAIDSIKIHKNP
jgi:predicted hydrocarbon binding protein